jgi:serine protease Do
MPASTKFMEEDEIMSLKKLFSSKRFLAMNVAIVVITAGVLLTGVLHVFGSAQMPAAGTTGPQTAAVVETEPASGSDIAALQQTFRGVSQKVLPVVVEIGVVDVVKQQVPEFQSPFDYFFGPQNGNNGQKEREFKRFGLGSGVIVRQTGDRVYVLTNNHVAGEAEEISVKLYDGRQFTAKLVGRDERRDLALVEFQAKEPVPVAELADSDLVQVGDIVFAVGNPLGFESTVTMGIVSAVGRRTDPAMGVGSFTDYIQTDAAINQGNSGGPLVDIYGRVVGVNTWISSPSGGSVGLGFTIPINNAKSAIEDFITKGKVEYGWLGVSMGDIPDEYRSDLTVGEGGGAFIYSVYQGSPADKAGILPGDFVYRINGEPVKDSTQFMYTVANLPFNKPETFDLRRGGKDMSLTVRVEKRKDDSELQNQAGKLWPGFSVVKITEDIQKQLDLPRRMGDLVIANVEQGSPAAVAGLRTGDIVLDINGTQVKNLSGFYRTLNDRQQKERLFHIYRQGTELSIGLVG